MKMMKQYSIKEIFLFVASYKVLAVSWGLALFGVIYMSYSAKTMFSYFGVAESREVNISSKHPVSIKQVHVISGQRVGQGQLILELERPDLALQINLMTSELKDLESQLRVNNILHKEIESIRFARVRGEESNSNPIINQIDQLKKRLNSLKEEDKNLKIYSQFEGKVGSINFKPGEEVSPFTTIMSLHGFNPSYIKGMIHERIHHKAYKGQEVKIISLSDPDKFVMAQVVSVGSRIIPFPSRLQKTGTAETWGREILIEIPTQNAFLLGEKVYIKTQAKKAGVINKIAERI